jgi:hypothetical protein
MHSFDNLRPRPVSRSGAAAGSVLVGFCPNNQGLRLRVLEEQRPQDGGPIQGDFVILDVGDNKHSEALRALLQLVTNAAEVLCLIRQEHPGCVSVANTNTLALAGAARPSAN